MFLRAELVNEEITKFQLCIRVQRVGLANGRFTPLEKPTRPDLLVLYWS